MDVLDKGMIHILVGMEQEGSRFHYATQNSLYFKTYELFYFWIFPFNGTRSQLTVVTEVAESGTVYKGVLLYVALSLTYRAWFDLCTLANTMLAHCRSSPAVLICLLACTYEQLP